MTMGGMLTQWRIAAWLHFLRSLVTTVRLHRDPAYVAALAAAPTRATGPGRDVRAVFGRLRQR